MVRRTITIDDDVNVWIQNYRGQQMRKTNKDFTYTEAVMLLCRKAIQNTLTQDGLSK